MHHKNSTFSLTVMFTDKIIKNIKNKIFAKMIDDDILEMIRRLTNLIEISIRMARFRLAAMSMDINKVMLITRGSQPDSFDIVVQL